MSKSSIWLIARSVMSILCIITTMYGCWDSSSISQIIVMGITGILVILTNAAYNHATYKEDLEKEREFTIRKSESARKAAEFELSYQRARTFDQYVTMK